MSYTNNFDILDPSVDIWQNRLIEASAGTGKTFAMENLFLRYLEETKDDLALEQMLAITFTKASTRELKERIYNRLEKSATSVASKRAKLSFDRAQIFTIHGFALRILNEFSCYTNACFSDQEYEKDFSLLKEQALKKALSSDELAANFCPEQLFLMASELFALGDEGLENHLSQISVLHTYQGIDTFKTSWQAFCSAMQERDHFDVNELYNQAEEFASFFNKKPSYHDIQEFCKVQCDENYFRSLLTKPWALENLIEENLNKTKRKKFEEKLYGFAPDFMRLAQKLSRITSRAKEKKRLLLPVFALSSKIYEELLEKTGQIDPDLLLKKLWQSCENEAFVRAVSARYKVVIIDEFQDTDPLQWRIFSKLFLESNTTCVHLVGDPKQSIYSFRGADVYTYLEAHKKIGNVERLCCNYRSQKPLIDALNAFFSKPTRGFLLLPKLGTTLTYQSVQSACNQEGQTPFHLLCVKEAKKEEAIESYLMPFFAQKVLHEVRANLRAFKDFAVLVSTHKDALSVYQQCKKYKIPSTLKKGQPLFYSRSYQTLFALITLLTEKSSLELFRYFLLTPLLRLEYSAHACLLWQEIASMYEKKGLLFALDLFFTLPWNGACSIHDELVSQHDFAELCIIEELIFMIAECYATSGKKLSRLLQLLEKKEKEEKASTENAVQILTAHVSKGLEFPVVFVFSLMSPETRKMPHWIKNGSCIHMAQDDPELLQIFEEEKKAEKLRQLYVALTRAKYELYVAHLPRGEKSALELFLARCHEAGDHEYSCEWAENFLSELAQQNILQKHTLEKMDLQDAYQESRPAIEEKKLCSYQVQPMRRYSFSMLAKHQVSDKVSTEKMLVDLSDKKNSYTIPKGTFTGAVVHEVLEEIIVKGWQNPLQLTNIAHSLAKKVAGTELEIYQTSLVSLIADGLSLKLPHINTSLKDLDKKKIHVELEFLHTFQQYDLMHGIIDIMFAHEQKFYLLDWKTNHLGFDENAYSEERLLEEMYAHDYFQQARIYTEALRRYLSHYTSAPFNDLFGGMYYVFLRSKKALHLTGDCLLL